MPTYSGTMNSLQEWNIVICSVFNKSFSRKYLDIIKGNLLSISNRIKPSYLWDIPVDTEKVTQLLHVLKQKNMISKYVVTLKMGEDVISSNFLELKCILNSIPNSFQRFINCSVELEKPEILKDLSGVNKVITELLDLTIKDGPKDVLPIEINSSWCVPCIFGVLLGYPVVYWTSSAENNLSSLPLNLFKVSYCGEQFSVKNLYSFTVPCSVELSLHVEQWKSSLTKNFPGDIAVTRETVKFSSIIM